MKRTARRGPRASGELLISCLEEALPLVDDGDRARLLDRLNDDELAVGGDGVLVDGG